MYACETYCSRMQFSGYDKRFRTQVVQSALSAYDKMLEKDAKGEEPLYRPRDWKRVERAKCRRAKKGEWFKGGEQGNETVIFVPATPGGELKRRYQEVIRAAKVKVGVSEVPGANLKKRLQYRSLTLSKNESAMTQKSVWCVVMVRVACVGEMV